MTDWNRFRGNSSQSGTTTDPGPVRGVVAWKAALGRQWYSRPVVRDGDVIVACPGRTGRKLMRLSLSDGSIVWEAIGTREPLRGSFPAGLRMSSQIIASDHSLFVRGLNYDALFEVSPDDGTVRREVPGCGALDYRVHPQPVLSGSGESLAYPLATGSGQSASSAQIDTGIWNTIAVSGTHDLQERWRFQIGQFFSEPLVSDQHLYVGTAEGYLYALSLHPGDPATRPVGTASPGRIAWSYRAGGPINGSMALDNGTLYAGSNDGVVTAFDAATGDVRWQTRVSAPADVSFIQISRPLVCDGSLFVGTAEAELVTLDARVGEITARRSAPDWIRACPATEGDTLVVASIDGTLSAFRTGSTHDDPPLWTRMLNQWLLTCDPVVSGDRLLVTTSDMVLWCLSLATGETEWSRAIVEYPDDYVAYDEFQSSPCVTGDSVLVGTPGNMLCSVDRETGRLQWRREFGGQVPADPICVEGRIYIGQQGGEGWYHCLDAASGQTVWRQRLGRVWAASSLEGGQLFVPAAEGVAYCLDPETGRTIWRYPAGSDLYVCPLVTEQLVLFGSWDEWLYALDRYSGEVVWKFHAETYLDSSAPAFAEGMIYLPTMGPRFYCLDAATGRERWRYIPDPLWTTNASPAVSGDLLVMTVFLAGGMPWEPYRVHTRCLNRITGELIWSFPSGGLNGPVIAGSRVYFASTSRGDHGFYCVELEGNGDGTTQQLFRVELGFTVLESCTAVAGDRAYVYAEDGCLYAIE